MKERRKGGDRRKRVLEGKIIYHQSPESGRWKISILAPNGVILFQSVSPISCLSKARKTLDGFLERNHKVLILDKRTIEKAEKGNR